MTINSIQVNPIYFRGIPQKNPKSTPTTTPINKNIETEQRTENKKMIGLAIAGAIGAALIGGAIGRRLNTKAIKDDALREAQETANKLKQKIRLEARNSADDYWRPRLDAEIEKVNDLTQAKTKLEEQNKILQTAKEALTENLAKKESQITELTAGDISPQEWRTQNLKKLQETIDNGNLDYDFRNPPASKAKRHVLPKDALPLPEKVGTTNRADMIDLQIPQIGQDGKFTFELPASKEMKISHMTSMEFNPTREVTTISENYADSVKWSTDKIARDFVQNFYDGHGQTLDGVKFIFTPTAEGKFKVRIEGKSTYTPDKALYIGESTKRDNAKAAGNYGEGLKMSVLKVLKDSGVKDVKIGSDEWQLVYTLEKGSVADKRVLAYSLDKTPKYDGNFIEFETTDRNLLDSFRNTITRFYHSNNPHFKCPDFENERIGIKLLPKGEKGGIYIAGQRFEFDGKFDGLDEIAIFLKEKPPLDVLDISRDRVSLNTFDLERIGRWLAREENLKPTTSNDDKVKLLKSLEKYWDYYGESPMHKFIADFLHSQHLSYKKLAIKFPEKYLAYSCASEELIKDLMSRGYRICHADFRDIGMPTIAEIIGNARNHDVIIPNDIQKKKILVLKTAIKEFAPSLKEKHFTPEELDTKIYLFDSTTSHEKKMYSGTLAEAITDNGVSKGFWIDRNYLDKASFHEVFETALHELTHKYGGDGSAEFSYGLTNVNRDVIGQWLANIRTHHDLTALDEIWRKLK